MNRADRRLILLLPVVIGVTILTLLLSTIVAQSRARDVETKAHSIYAIAVPAINHLSDARAELRRMEVLLQDHVERVTRGQGTEDISAKFSHASESFERDWDAYTSLAPYEGERELWTQMVALRAQKVASVSKVLSDLQARDVSAAEHRLDTETKPLIDRVDEGLLQGVQLNARNAAALGEAISAATASSHRLAVILHLVSVLLASAAGFILVRVTRRHLQILSCRVSDLEHFAGRVAHDIRSPLTSVGLTLELAKRGALSEARVQTMLERGTRTIQRIGQLVDGLLVFARAGANPLEGAHANVKEALDGVSEEMLPVAAEKEIELCVERMDPCVVACSIGVLTSLLSNLVGNAIKYMGNAPLRRVMIRVIDLGSIARIEVEDTGPGVPKELQERIFDPYFRAAEATIPGLGLGLATIRRLVDAHGGAVGVDAKEPGSLFWFQLPKAQEPAPTASRGLEHHREN